MLKNIKIQNYRGIKDLEIKDFKKINLLVGDNNSGKTSVLEAILLASSPNILPIFTILNFRKTGFFPDLDKVNLQNYKLWEDILCLANERNDKKKIKITAKSNYQNKIRKIDAEISFTNKIISFSNKQSAAAPSIFNQNEINSLVAEYKINDKKTIRLGFSKNQTFDALNNSDNIPIPRIIPNRIAKAGDLQYGISQVVKNNDEKSLVKILEKIDPKIKNIKNNGDEILCDIGEISIPLENMGDGIIQILNILLMINDSKNNILLIDEIDNGLHWKTQKIMWKAVIEASKQANVQIFATTHSYETIKSLVDLYEDSFVDKDDIMLYSLDTKDDKNYVNVFDANFLERAINTGGEVR